MKKLKFKKKIIHDFVVFGHRVRIFFTSGRKVLSEQNSNNTLKHKMI